MPSLNHFKANHFEADHFEADQFRRGVPPTPPTIRLPLLIAARNGKPANYWKGRSD